MSRRIKLISSISLLTLMFISVSCIGIAPITANASGETITYMGVTRDVTDFDALGYGQNGYWFAQCNAPYAMSGRPTGERQRDYRETWINRLYHYPEDWNFLLRTFSQDGPTRSKGGYTSWSTLKIPSGEVLLSGAVVDPYTNNGNSNNTVNRIQIDGNNVPNTFYFHVVVDNTNLTHLPTEIRARGNNDRYFDDPVEANDWPSGTELTYNNVPDVYTWRYDNFDSGDYIKVRLRGGTDSGGASIAGWMFDIDWTPGTTFEPAQ